MGVAPAEAPAEVRELAAQVPAELRMGTSSWTFPGWAGAVYDREVSERVLQRDGLAAYARHPLLRTVGVDVDRTFYAPVDVATFAAMAAAVPADFRFVVKAHGLLTTARFSRHERWGEARGLENPGFLDVDRAVSDVVEPYREGLRDRAGVLLFQFPPQRIAGGPASFARRLREFLAALPPGPQYAVEVRNPELLTDAYSDALARVGALHCLVVHPTMPSLVVQARATRAWDADTMIIRWMLAPHLDYESARAAFAPFDRLVEPDPTSRAEVVEVLARHQGKRYLVVNNKAEGSSPCSIIEVARALVGRAGGLARG
jgi:uncharacterized protein YecE (DUF72 family)